MDAISGMTHIRVVESTGLLRYEVRTLCGAIANGTISLQHWLASRTRPEIAGQIARLQRPLCPLCAATVGKSNGASV
jgi:hypothetical protein